jgi:chaperone modulatory protein CbpM
VTYALVLADRLDTDSFARVTGLHPDLVRRLVAAGVLDPRPGPGQTLWFSQSQVADVARIQRLRAAFALNYAALSLVVDLLDRIDGLEAALRGRPQQRGSQRWTPAA